MDFLNILEFLYPTKWIKIKLKLKSYITVLTNLLVILFVINPTISPDEVTALIEQYESMTSQSALMSSSQFVMFKYCRSGVPYLHF